MLYRKLTFYPNNVRSHLIYLYINTKRCHPRGDQGECKLVIFQARLRLFYGALCHGTVAEQTLP